MMEPLDYHSPHSKELTRTALTCFMASRQDYHDIYVAHTRQPKPPRKCMERGIVLHAVLVEGRNPETLLEIFPDSCLDKNGNLKRDGGWRLFKADNPDKFCVKPAERSGLWNLIVQVTANPIIAADRSDSKAKREYEIRRNIDGIDCKTKLDLWRPDQNPIDYKFCAAVDPEAFRRGAKSWGWWTQDAHYTRVVQCDFVTFRCIEVTEPFRVYDYWFDMESRSRAFDKHCWLLGELKACRESGDWSEQWPHEISLPPWTFNQNLEDELVEVGEAYET